MSQDDKESNSLDSLEFYVEPRLVNHPEGASEWLSKYCYAENAAGLSKAGLWHASSIGALHPSGHNTNSSKARFGGGISIGGMLG